MTLAQVVLLTLAAGMSIPLGAAMASVERLQAWCLKTEMDSFVSYFGGGALLAAIALVLLPRGLEQASPALAIGTFLAGGLMFWQISAQLERRHSSASNLMGMLLDFIPEAIILGAAASQGFNTALLLALFIALQNMPEGFAARNEMRQAGMGTIQLRTTFGLAPLAGPLAGWFGYSCIDMGSLWLGGIMLFCSGGILYLIFQDIAPRAHLQHHHFPALGAVTGFLLGMTGTMLLH